MLDDVTGNFRRQREWKSHIELLGLRDGNWRHLRYKHVIGGRRDRLDQAGEKGGSWRSTDRLVDATAPRPEQSHTSQHGCQSLNFPCQFHAGTIFQRWVIAT